MDNQEPEAISDFARSVISQMGELTSRRIDQAAIGNARLSRDETRSGQSILDLRKTKLVESDSAVVIAAGPSLHRQDTASMLRRSNFKGSIIATESSMSWCLRNDIVPDLVVTVDPHASRIVRWFGDPALTVESLATDDYFSRQDMDPGFREDQIKMNRELMDILDRHGKHIRIAVSSSASRAVVARCSQIGMNMYWWNPFFDDYDLPDSLTREVYKLNGKPCINAGGNVGTACWVIAHAILEKKRIALLGMDLGYYGDTPYAQTQYYRELVEILGEDRIADAFVHMKNPHTNCDFFSDPAYFWYRTIFLEMAQEVAERGVRTVNCTGGGILYGDGVEFMSFEEFLAGR